PSIDRIDPTIGATDTPDRRLRYRPGTALARTVRLRDGTCRHPGCTVPADYCDLDHLVPFDHSDPATGGHTEECNLGCFCRRHHRFNHSSGRRYTMDPDGTLHVPTPAAPWPPAAATSHAPNTPAGTPRPTGNTTTSGPPAPRPPNPPSGTAAPNAPAPNATPTPATAPDQHHRHRPQRPHHRHPAPAPNTPHAHYQPTSPTSPPTTKAESNDNSPNSSTDPHSHQTDENTF